MCIRDRLKDLRLNKGLKLEELAEQTGISKSALGSYEKDDYKEINHGNLIPVSYTHLTPGTEESKEPPKKQPIKEALQDKVDEKKAQRTAPAHTKHKQQDMEL